jgi:hypothetical protein
VEVSALSGRGIIAPVSARLQNGVCFLHHPLPATDSARFYNRTCRNVPRRCYGLTLFRATSTGQEAPAFLPMIVLSACPHQARGTSDHVPFWSEPVSRFGSSSLTAFISGSRYVEPLTQPSASTGFRLPVSRDVLANITCLCRRLHCQCASHKVVTNPALHLGYRRLNTGSHSDRPCGRATTRYTAFHRVQQPISTGWRLAPTPNRVISRAGFPLLIDASGHQRSGRSADRTRLFRSHAWEASALPLSYTRGSQQF